MKQTRSIYFPFLILLCTAIILSMTNCNVAASPKQTYQITGLSPDSELSTTDTLRQPSVTPSASSQSAVLPESRIDITGNPEDTSPLTDNDNLKYYYQTTEYCYGITADGQEFFSQQNADGTQTDIVNGSAITIKDTSDKILCRTAHLSGVELLEDEPTESIRVTYETTDDDAVFTTTYTFYEHYVKATSKLSNFQTTASIGTAYLERSYPNSYTGMEQKMNSNWVFPDNQDFPYKEFDSYVTVHSIDSAHKLYTFYHGEDANIKEFYEYYPKDRFLLETEDGQLKNTRVDYELVFENEEVDSDCDYFALFKSKGQPLAIGVAPTERNACGSSVFTDKNTQLNLNISNMDTETAEGVLTFHLYDYYGNDLVNDTHAISLKGRMACNRILDLSEITNGKTGIYYLDMMLCGEDYTYRELYPFALLADYDYVYREDNPFGISGMHFGEYEANDTTIYLADVLGMSHARVGISTPEYVSSDYTLLKTYLEKLKAAGIQVSGQFILMDNWTYPTDSISFGKRLDKALSETSPWLTAMEIGNEQNMIDVSYNYFESESASMEYYLKTQFSIGDQITESYDLPLISAGVGLCDSEWLNLLDKTGIFDASDILSTHAYSYPHSPDFTKDITVTHSFESSLVRVRSFLDRVGDKTWYLSEMGLPTTPLSTENTFSGVDLRTQADYTIREYLLALSYGADVVESYSLYDQINMFKGMDNENNEFHFGMFYDQDYYGRILPKPYAVAYATMTRQMDGVRSVCEVDSPSDTVRLFQITLADGETFHAAYSTAHRLSNDAVTGKRTPNLPWQNQWRGQETVSFTASSDADVYTIDLMGNKKNYRTNKKGTVSIPVDGSPVFLYGISSRKQ